jgi:hypothetical protein
MDSDPIGHTILLLAILMVLEIVIESVVAVRQVSSLYAAIKEHENTIEEQLGCRVRKAFDSGKWIFRWAKAD